MKKNGRITENELKKILENRSLKVRETFVNPQNKSFEEIIQEKQSGTKTKRKNNHSNILNSLKTASITIDGSAKQGEEFISIIFDGARALSLNEILSISQTRKYDLFSYKKEWQKLVNKAVILLPHNKRFQFDSPCKITLFRQGVKFIDLDGFQAMFKYLIDALRYANILSEDNPNIMFKTESIQNKGKSYMIGIKIEKIQEEISSENVDVFSLWFTDKTPTFHCQ